MGGRLVTDPRIEPLIAESEAAQRAERDIAEGREPQEADLNTLLNVLTTRNAMAPCTCGHTAKKHKRSGHCRKSCTCDWALRKHDRKRKRAKHV